MKAPSFARRGERRRGMRVGETNQLAQLQNAIFSIAVQEINTLATAINTPKMSYPGIFANFALSADPSSPANRALLLPGMTIWNLLSTKV